MSLYVRLQTAKFVVSKSASKHRHITNLRVPLSLEKRPELNIKFVQKSNNDTLPRISATAYYITAKCLAKVPRQIWKWACRNCILKFYNSTRDLSYGWRNVQQRFSRCQLYVRSLLYLAWTNRSVAAIIVTWNCFLRFNCNRAMLRKRLLECVIFNKRSAYKYSHL